MKGGLSYDRFWKDPIEVHLFNLLSSSLEENLKTTEILTVQIPENNIPLEWSDPDIL